MTTIKVNLKKQQTSYPIVIEDGLFKKVPQLIKKNPFGKKYAIITDTNVAQLYGENFKSKMDDIGLPTEIFIFPPGDTSKRLDMVEKIANHMLRKKINRHDAIITLGGGVPGDIGGFLASIYMRGIPYIHIPTSVIGMCDSGIGGKTGVNLQGGKNLIGRIEQPQAVFIDPSLLKTLPEKEYITGLGEVVKYGAIMDIRLFTFLEKALPKIQKKDPETMNKFIEQSIKNKKSIIKKDVNEKGLRKILNYGHTLGHAIEKSSNHKISHGEAICIGMKTVNTMAHQKRYLSQAHADRINNLIDELNIISQEGVATIHPQNSSALWKLMEADKKAQNGSIQFIIPTAIGEHKIVNSFTKKDFTDALKTLYPDSQKSAQKSDLKCL